MLRPDWVDSPKRACRRRRLTFLDVMVAQKRFILCYRTIVCDVSVFWPNGWMDQDDTWYRGRSWPRLHCLRWGRSSLTTERGTATATSATAEMLLKKFSEAGYWVHTVKISHSIRHCFISSDTVSFHIYHITQHLQWRQSTRAQQHLT